MATCAAGLDEGSEETDQLLPLPQCLPRAVPRDRGGGYDCDFVEPPPEAIQAECPVCLQVLREPCLISCCGHKFCRECIERVKKDRKLCPLCSKQDFTFMRELGLERSLKELEVWCSYKHEGCEWRGKLGKLEEHLNQDPSPESQLNGCECVVVECMYYKCGEWFQRRHIATHQNEQCKKRPYSCDYCRDYASTFEDVIGVHYPQCGKYPVTCPNDCGTHKMERQNVEGHLRDVCPLELVDCPFHYAGCETQLPRKDMPEHMKDTVTHLTLLATVTQRLSVENQKLTKENQQLQQRIEEDHKIMQITKQEFQSFKEEGQKRIGEVQTLLQQQITELTDRVGAQQEKFNHPGFPIYFRLKPSKHSPAFYTNLHGYRMRISVDFDEVDGLEYLSIFTHIVRGPFDDYLKWPFRGKITIQLVNQAGCDDHIEEIIPYTDTTPDDCAGRVSQNHKRSRGWGQFKFVQRDSHTMAQYLENGYVQVCVVKVLLT